MSLQSGTTECRVGNLAHAGLCHASSLSTPTLWSHRTDLNRPWTRIHLWLLFEKFSLNTPGIYPHGLEGGGQNRFFGPTLNNILTQHISATEHDMNNEKKISIYGDFLTFLPNLVNYGLETAENGWRFFAHPLNFCIGTFWETLPARPALRYITDNRQTLTRAM